MIETWKEKKSPIVDKLREVYKGKLKIETMFILDELSKDERRGLKNCPKIIMCSHGE